LKTIKTRYILTLLLSTTALSFFFFACKKDKEITAIDLGYEYYPNKIGNFVVYQVDSLYYNDFTGTIDTFNFQIKEKITENFSDLSNRESQRIERYYRKNENENWLLKDVWYLNRTSNTAEKVEENVRFVKVIFPLKKEMTWNGNRFNSLGEKNYTLTKLHEPFTIGQLNFDSTIYISQEADSNLIEKKIAFEIYAKHIGLVYKKSFNIFDKDSVINFTLPIELRANSGFDVIYRAISSGNE
jgi:hypothetical protein